MKNHDLNFWVYLKQNLSLQSGPFIDGQMVEPLSGESFSAINPATEQVLGQISACGAADVDRAVRSGRAAFEDGGWGRAAPAKRKAILLRLSALILERGEELALMESLDMGKPVRDALAIDIPGAAEAFAWYAEAIDKVYGEIAPTDPSALAMVTREPVGVVGAVVPWNFPLLMASWKVAPALAAGNSVILKPAEQSSLTALRLAELAVEAGIPAGVLNVVPGFGPIAGRALGLHPDVDVLTFTGSTAVGAMYLRYAADSNLKQVSLETGGKSPHLVFADCSNLDKAARAVAAGIFFNQGEVCNAGSRLLVEASIKDRLIGAILDQAARFEPGDPLDPKTRMGAMVDAHHCGRVMDFITSGQTEGARLLTGGERVRVHGVGHFIRPTIFDQVTPGMTILREEIFGPVLTVQSFQTEAEAIHLANDGIHGLAAGLWTSGLDRAHRLSRALQAGIVWVNCYDSGDMTVPFGGVKQSGFGGRDRSLHALDKYTQLKTTWVRIDTTIQK